MVPPVNPTPFTMYDQTQRVNMREEQSLKSWGEGLGNLVSSRVSASLLMTWVYSKVVAILLFANIGQVVRSSSSFT